MSLAVFTERDLRAGDVLLFNGNGVLSRFIRLFDGSQYSHAAIFDGTSVVEAEAEKGEAVRTDSVAIACSSAAYTHVYRFYSNDHRKLGEELPFAPVGKNIDFFKSTPEAYAYSQIFLLGLLLATRRVPLPGMTPMLRPFLDEAVQHLNDWVNAKKKVIICSELVYECFDNVPDPAYLLDVEGVDPEVVPEGLKQRQNLAPSMTSQTADGDFEKDVAAFLATYRLAKTRPSELSSPIAQGERAVPAFVTPRDLSTSPNLNLVGQLVATAPLSTPLVTPANRKLFGWL